SAALPCRALTRSPMLARFFLLRAANCVLRFSSLRFRGLSQTGRAETHRTNGCGRVVSNCVGSAVTIVENAQRENLLMDVVKQAKRAGGLLTAAQIFRCRSR